MAWLFSFSGAVPAAVCVVAQVFTGHSVIVEQTAHGVCIKLEHEDDGHHTERPAAMEEALSLLTSECPDHDGGHHVDFSSSHVDADLIKVSSMAARPVFLQPMFAPVLDHEFLAPAAGRVLRVRPDACPSNAGSVPHLRTTVLVI